MIDTQPDYQRKDLPWLHLTARSYDFETGVFFLQSESKPKPESRLGMMWSSPPMIGADDGTMERFRSVFSTPFPVGTFIQIGLMSMPDVSSSVNAYVNAKVSDVKLLREMAVRRGQFISDASIIPLKELNEVTLTSQRVLVSITIPCDEDPGEDVFKDFIDNAQKVRDGLFAAGLRLQQVNAEGWLAIMRRFFDKKHDDDHSIADFTPLREQVFSPGNDFEIRKNEIVFNDAEYFARFLSVKFFPRKTSLGIMNMIVGDPKGSANQITEPFWMATTIHYIKTEDKINKIRQKHMIMLNQSFSNVISSIPLFAHKKRGLDMMMNEVEGNGAILVEMNFTITLFSDNEKRTGGLIGALSAWANSFGLELVEDKRILCPLFFNILPFGQTSEGIKKLFRFHTMTVNQSIQFLPVLGDWTGSGNGASSIMMTRRGRPVLFDPYDSSTNYNGVVFAEPGGGKSFVAQQVLVCDVLGQGGKVWAIDQGRSYQKLCSVVGGQFIEFSDESNICLNPFTFVQDIEEEMDMLKAVFAKMAAPEAGLDDFRMSVLEQAIKATWDHYTSNSSVSEVANWCTAQPDQRITDIGQQLYPFTRHGSFGRWFDGKANVDFTADFVVLELQELSAKKTLQQVVLMLLLHRIGVEMYFDKTNRKKVVLVDEAWSLFDDPVVGQGIAAGFRKVRKHDGAMWVITQSIADLYESPNGRVIIDNCAWQIILQQRSESIEAAVKTGRLGLDPYAKDMLKSVHTLPGRFSEMMIRRGSDEWGIVRFVADRFSQILFSTKGWERNEVLAVAQSGGDVAAFINSKIAEEERSRV
ncbi:type IV secretion system protein TraC [Ferrovum myxofaciens]|uniref:Type IV secretion system protein TraC n=1 Tax=Ferrovum myxofaciens TaxID=416213 RepID=A0A9E6SXU7_9PROT|nr:type IV secretion system protein TraC [Ferrovum myxofaciens]QKE37375.1 MAG: type IV secretion system protein TraC [Ferrovum myxofaciens]QWY75029.1 MAG: type IV secretion system protein TraC [Ferrovum myxofaciens]QWY77769.1 MAG: type IV secretion system protein TraC [Ferrovum myxofaciens]